MSDVGGWYGPGVAPEEGRRYEFEDFVGARFTATVASVAVEARLAQGGARTDVLVLRFTDRDPFETNLPIRFRDA